MLLQHERGDLPEIQRDGGDVAQIAMGKIGRAVDSLIGKKRMGEVKLATWR